MKIHHWILIIISIILVSACQTKTDIRRQQELEKMRQELTQVKGDRADLDNVSEEFKVELSRTNNLIEDKAAQAKQQQDDIRKDLATLTARVQALEQRASAPAASEEPAERPRPAERKATFEVGKRLYDEGKYSDAEDVFRTVTQHRSQSPDEARKALYWLGETHFADKEYASAALEFSEFKKAYPKDNLVPQAIYRQANSFRNLNKSKEAKLFYQELLERFPKSPLAKKAKAEMKKLK